MRVIDPLVPVIVSANVPVAAEAVVVIVSVEVLPVVLVGLNEAVAPAPSPETVKPTAPMNPPVRVIAMVYEVVCPCMMLRLAGVALMVKFAAGAVVTTSVAEAVWVSVPLVPVIVSGYVPVGVDDAVVTLSAELAPLAVVGLNVPAAPVGRPATLKVTAPANPPVRVMFTV